MHALLKLFGRSPFAPLQAHMDKAARCVKELEKLFGMLLTADQATIEEMAETIARLEHEADVIKNDIRNHLPTTLFLPVDRASLLEILSLQDSIADQAEDIAMLLTLHPVQAFEDLKVDFDIFLKKNLEAVEGACHIIHELTELLETSFGGSEAERVRVLVDHVALCEHEADVLQRSLLKKLFGMADRLDYVHFYQWQAIFRETNALSDVAESLANRVRMTLELK